MELEVKFVLFLLLIVFNDRQFLLVILASSFLIFTEPSVIISRLRYRPQLPKFTSNVVNKYLTPLSGPYQEICKAYYSTKREDLEVNVCSLNRKPNP